MIPPAQATRNAVTLITNPIYNYWYFKLPFAEYWRCTLILNNFITWSKVKHHSVGPDFSYLHCWLPFRAHVNCVIHPFIHYYLYNAQSSWGSRGAGAYPSWFGTKAGDILDRSLLYIQWTNHRICTVPLQWNSFRESLTIAQIMCFFYESIHSWLRAQMNWKKHGNHSLN